MRSRSEIDISENTLRNRGCVLDILLLDKSARRNIIWATDSYVKYGKSYAPTKPITRAQITGAKNGKRIQPRAAKPREEQIARTKDKAEVFTPLNIVDRINKSVEQGLTFPPNHTWQDYIATKWLEITCGEAPFIAGRYDPTANTGVVIEPKKRVGFLDRKLQVVSKNTETKKDWLHYTEIALKATYGYEWQGDNLLIARENVLQTVDDFYKDFCTNKLQRKSVKGLKDEQLERFAKIISWNIFQMDGLKYVIPLSGDPPAAPDFNKNQVELPLPLDMVDDTKSQKTITTGIYAKIKNWDAGKAGKTIRFVDILSK